eukprot:228869_1
MGNRNTKQSNLSKQQLETYQHLLCMGFNDEQACLEAIKKFKGNLNQCITFLTQTKRAVVSEDVNEQKKEKHIPLSSPASIVHNKTVMKAKRPHNNNSSKSDDIREDIRKNNTFIREPITIIKPHAQQNVFDAMISSIATEADNSNEINEIINIYQQILNMASPKQDSVFSRESLCTLHSKFCEIKRNIANEQNNETLYEIYKYFMSHMNGKKCDPNECEYVRIRYRNRCKSLLHSKCNHTFNNITGSMQSMGNPWIHGSMGIHGESMSPWL